MSPSRGFDLGPLVYLPVSFKGIWQPRERRHIVSGEKQQLCCVARVAKGKEAPCGAGRQLCPLFHQGTE